MAARDFRTSALWLMMAMGTASFHGAPLHAGPPLIIDDPGILDPGQWEWILAVDGVEVGDSRFYRLPLLDVSYGLTDNTQLSFSLPRLVLDADGESRRSGPGFASFGYKWRFASSDVAEWALAPAYAVPASHEVIREDGPEDIHVLGIPLLYQRSFGSLTALAQVAWFLGSDGGKAWDFGAALTYPVTPRAEVMVELFGVADSDFNYETLIYQVGIDFAVSDDFHLLGSFGRRLKSRLGSSARLDHQFYFGLQWFR